MIKQRFISGSSLPNLKENKLLGWLSSELDARLPQPSLNEATSYCPIYWGASYFGLDKVKSFQNASKIEQAEILRLCSSEVIQQIYTIKKACVSYMAKMVLMHESTEEQMLYGLFGADEVMHLKQISQFLQAVQIPAQQIEENQLLKFLNDVINTHDRAVILFVLLVLDGWSLSYYRSLAIECREPDLSLTLQTFLPDKSRHHATGVMLFHNLSLTSESQNTIVETLSKFLLMMQIEPQQTIVSAIEQIKGDLSRLQKIRIFEELDTENQSLTRLKFLRSLMRNPNSGTIVQMLEVRGAFQPFSSAKYLCKV
jgi:tRNA isopentenyl-2-thiomethyl-A-37 hydroxylase MiaE